MKLIIIGPPGAGKGTQAKFIKEQLAIPHISTGEIFRDNIEKQTPLGIEVKSILASGDLVPDEVTIAIAKNRLKEEDAQNGFLLDGFPRNVSQAEALDAEVGVELVLNLVLEDDVVVQRLSGRRVCECGSFFNINIPYMNPKVEGICDQCGKHLIQREDDNEVTIRNRLKVFHEQIAPVIDHYKMKGKVKDIDGDNTPDVVSKLILKALEE